MEIIDLNVFAAVVEQKTTTQAAKFLGMTQPGVSKHLSRLEREVGGQLFRRAGKYLTLNEFGEFLYEKAKKILGDINTLSDLGYGSASPLGSLKLGLTDAATLLVTPPSLYEFRKRYPGVHISLDVDSSKVIEEGVLRGDYDLGVVTAGLKLHAHLVQETLYDDYIDPVVATNHELVSRKRIVLKELANYPLIISPKRRRTRAIIDSVFRENEIHLRDTIDVYNQNAAVRFAEAGLGVAMLPRAFITREIPHKRCTHLKIDGDPIKRTLCIIQRKDAKHSAAVECFHSIIMKSIKQI